MTAMQGLSAIFRVGLALVFGLAAAGKARDLRSSSTAARQLGLPEQWASIVGPALPFVEALLALGLLVHATARVAALGSLAMLAAFTVVLAVNLAAGRRPSCNCFGAASDRPIGPWSIARNVGLLAAAALVAAVPGDQGVAGYLALRMRALEDVRLAVAVLGLACAAEAVALFHLWRRPPTGLPAVSVPEGLPIGAHGPEFELRDLDGERHRLVDVTDRGLPTLLVFIDPKCEACSGLLPELADWQASFHEVLSILTISTGSAAANRQKLGDYAVAPVLLQRGEEVADAYRVSGTPGGALLDGHGDLLAPVALGADRVRLLAEEAIYRAQAAAPAPEPPPVGDLAPVFTLPDVGGEEVSLVERRGRLTLLVHWSPTCVFCRELHPELRTWEASLDPETGPRLVVVSSGSPAANRAEGFVSPVVLDDHGLTRRALGFEGTPSALLVDADGRVASGLMVGAEAVMDLARRSAELSSAASRLEGRRIPVNAARGSDGYGTQDKDGETEVSS